MKIYLDILMKMFSIKKHKPSVIKEALDNPENFILEAFAEGEEIIIKIKKREL